MLYIKWTSCYTFRVTSGCFRYILYVVKWRNTGALLSQYKLNVFSESSSNLSYCHCATFSCINDSLVVIADLNKPPAERTSRALSLKVSSLNGMSNHFLRATPEHSRPDHPLQTEMLFKDVIHSRQHDSYRGYLLAKGNQNRWSLCHVLILLNNNFKRLHSVPKTTSLNEGVVFRNNWVRPTMALQSDFMSSFHISTYCSIHVL